MGAIRNKNHFATGLFLIAVALLAFYLSRRLGGITDVGLGPGFVPRMFAFIQLGLGAALVASGFLTTDEDHERWQLRPLLVIVSIVFFCIAIERLGLVIALVGQVLISCAAHPGTKFHEAVALAVGAAVFSVVVFVKLLGLSIAVWPQNLFGG